MEETAPAELHFAITLIQRPDRQGVKIDCFGISWEDSARILQDAAEKIRRDLADHSRANGNAGA